MIVHDTALSRVKLEYPVLLESESYFNLTCYWTIHMKLKLNDPLLLK